MAACDFLTVEIPARRLAAAAGQGPVVFGPVGHPILRLVLRVNAGLLPTWHRDKDIASLFRALEALSVHQYPPPAFLCAMRYFLNGSRMVLVMQWTSPPWNRGVSTFSKPTVRPLIVPRIRNHSVTNAFVPCLLLGKLRCLMIAGAMTHPNTVG